MSTLTITRPDDWHLHLRDGAQLAAVVGDSARRFARALVMPNLDPPVTETDQALRYRQRIVEALPAEAAFEPWLSLYLTEETPVTEVARARDSGAILGMKYYPAGATTGSARGVGKPERVYPVLEAMQERGLPLQVHAELPDVDVGSREEAFIDRVLDPMLRRLEGLQVVFEHVSTRVGVDFVRGGVPRVAATLTPQHLLHARGDLFRCGKLRPHNYCLPMPGTEDDRRALVAAATGGEACFFLGTDSAPHPRRTKESDGAPAGVYSACAALELYAEVFETAGRLDRLEAFASSYGARFYRLPRNRGRITLERFDWTLPAELPYGEDSLVPLRAGERCRWRLA